MRLLLIVVAAMGLVACMKREDQPAKTEAKGVALAFDGAGAGDPAAIVKHGKRLNTVLSCNGCHGPTLQGRNVTADDPPMGEMNAPNLTLLMASYSDAELDRAIRGGIAKDGRKLWFMPSETYSHLGDSDLAALVAYLRTVKPAGQPLPPIRKGPRYLAEIEQGIYTDAPGMVKRYAASQPVDLGPTHALGRYLAKTTCTECHNGALQGFANFSPNLDIAGSYSAAELTHLLTTGEGKVKKDLGLMSMTARASYSRLTEGERNALVAYLKARVDRPQ